MFLDSDIEDYENTINQLNEWREKLMEENPAGTWNFASFEELNIGDIIYVDYLTSSQKYIYTFTPVWGTVISSGKIFCEIKLKNEAEEKPFSIYKEGCHLTGYCKGLSYAIYKFSTN